MLSTFRSVRFVRVLVALWIAYATYTMARRPFSVARDAIQRETGLSTLHTSFIDTAFMLTYTLGQLQYSHIKESLGRKQLLVYGILFSALASGCVAISSSLWAFCIAWAFNGFAQAVGWSTCLSILNVWLFPHERGKVMGWWSTNMAAGGVIGNILPAYIMSCDFTWRVAIGVEVVCLVCVGVITSVVLVHHPNIVGYPSVQQQELGLTWNTLRECKPCTFTKDGEIIFVPRTGLKISVETDEERLGKEEFEVNKDDRSVTAWMILKWRGVGGICVSYFIHKLVRYAFMFWLPYYATNGLKYATVDAGFVSSLFDVGGVVGTILSGYASDFFFGGCGRTRVILIFTLGMALSTWSLSMFHHVFEESKFYCSLTVALVGFFSFGIDSLMTGSFLLDFLEHTQLAVHAGAVSGVVGGVGSAGSILQGIFTVMFGSNSWTMLFQALSAATILAGLSLYQPLIMEIRR